MSRNHQAFLMDSNGFQERIQSASLGLASGSARILFEDALHVVSELRNDWILSETEGPLMDIRSTSFAGIPYKEAIDNIVDDCAKINPADIGYWFLIILSAYLRKCEGIGKNFEVLEWCLGKLGWGIQDINYLIYGNPTSLLLKNDSSTQPTRLTYDSPYWFWMKPAYVNRCGWFSKQQVHAFLAKLDMTESRLNVFSSKEFGTQWGYVPLSIPEGQLEYLNYAKIGYGSAKRMLDFAFKNNQDLFLVVTD